MPDLAPAKIPLVALAFLSLLACCDTPSPHHDSAEAFFARRRQTQPLTEIASRAETQGDSRRALAAYELLTELWPDFPEARMGGLWSDGARKHRRVLRQQTHIDQTRHSYLALEQRLRDSRAQINLMDQTLRDTFAAPPPIPPLLDPSEVRRTGLSMARAALSSGHQGVLSGSIEAPPSPTPPEAP